MKRAHELGYRDTPRAAVDAPPPAPAPAPEGLRTTPGRLAEALHKLGEDAARLQLRLRGLSPFLGRDDGRLELVHDSLRAQACALVDLATAVRLGELPLVAYRADEAPAQLPLFPEPDGEPAAKPRRRRKAKAEAAETEAEA